VNPGGRLSDEYQDAVNTFVRNPSAYFRVALDDRFDAPKLAWPSEPLIVARRATGGYRITPRLENEFVAIGAPLTETFRDVLVGATFKKVGGPDTGVYGLLLRDRGPMPRDGRNQTGRFYLGQVAASGAVSIWRREQDLWFELVPWKGLDAVRTGDAPNDVSFETVGGRLTLTVNGETAASTDDAVLDQGGVGLFVAGGGNDVLVQRFVVHALR
jgi:hypothetical protein